MTDVFLIEDLGQQRLQARTWVSALRAAGLSARLVDFGPNQDPEPIIELVRADLPRWVVFSVLFAHLLDTYLALAARLRADVPTVRLALAGPLPALARDALLAARSATAAIDAVLQGDLATAVVEVAGEAACPGALAGGEIFLRPARDDGIPERLGFGYVTVEGSRGCWHDCTFCLPRAFYRARPGPAYRLRSVPDLVDEIGSLYARGARLFLFDDEQFLPPRGRREVRVREWAAALERRGLAIAFTAKLRPDDVDRALCRELQAAGLIRAYLGVESGSQATLDLLGKGVTPDNLRALATLDDLGIIADFRMLMFHPWTTPESLRTDLDFLRQALPLTSTLFAYREVELYPGTPMAEQFVVQAHHHPDSYPFPYVIFDPRAELLRRLGRLVFGPRDVPGGLHDRLTSAWFDVLLLQRFGPGDRVAPAVTGTRLRAAVARLNAGSLDVWVEMLDFAAHADIRDADVVNKRAAAWAGRVAALDSAELWGQALVSAWPPC